MKIGSKTKMTARAIKCRTKVHILKECKASTDSRAALQARAQRTDRTPPSTRKLHSHPTVLPAKVKTLVKCR